MKKTQFEAKKRQRAPVAGAEGGAQALWVSAPQPSEATASLVWRTFFLRSGEM